MTIPNQDAPPPNYQHAYNPNDQSTHMPYYTSQTAPPIDPTVDQPNQNPVYNAPPPVHYANYGPPPTHPYTQPVMAPSYPNATYPVQYGMNPDQPQQMYVTQPTYPNQVVVQTTNSTLPSSMGSDDDKAEEVLRALYVRRIITQWVINHVVVSILALAFIIIGIVLLAYTYSRSRTRSISSVGIFFIVFGCVWCVFHLLSFFVHRRRYARARIGPVPVIVGTTRTRTRRQARRNNGCAIS